MPDFFIILLKINLVLVLFAVAYYLILRRLTFYVLNRVFLVFGILFSTLYPFIDLTDFFHQQNQQLVAFVPEFNQKVAKMVPISFFSNYWLWISLLFYVGVVFMAFRLVVQFISLYRMHKKSSPGSVADFNVRILDEPVSPFSFWQTVYINPSLHKERELKTILTHEQIHVKQWHSLDIILAELSVVFYWFNPGVWLMKKAVKENLEFITDEKILKQGIDKKAYQYSLLDVGNLIPAVEIVNNFNLSDLKKRIQMMNVKRSSKFTLSRYLLVFPVLLVTTLAFTVSKKDIQQQLKPLNLIFENQFSKTLEPVTVKRTIANVELGAKKVHLKALKNEGSGNNSDFNQPAFETKALLNDGIDEITKQLLTQMAAQRAKQSDTTIVIQRYVHGIDLSSKQIAFLDTKTQEFSENINDKVAKQNVKAVGYEFKVKGIKIDQDLKEVTVNGSSNPNTSSVQDIIVIGSSTKKAVESAPIKIFLRGVNLKKDADSIGYTFNGKKVTEEDVSKINPNQIESVAVKKGKPSSEVVIIGYAYKNKP